MDKKKVALKEKLDQKRVISYIEDLVKSFKGGTICIQQNDDFVTLKPAQLVDFKIEASVKNDKEKLCLELSWQQQNEKEEKGVKLTISSAEPFCEPEAKTPQKAEPPKPGKK